jgi:hypothetical protein
MKHFKLLTAILALTLSIALNSVMGATLACAAGFSPAIGAVTGNAVGLLARLVMPQGCALASVFTEIWTGEMIKAFRTPAESLGWYDRIRSYDQYVDNDVIHFTELGGDPSVLVNNTTYPLAIETLTDADKPISLDKFDTTATPVTDDELHACSYDKMSSVQERHREALREKVMQKAIHAIAPAVHNAATAPVLLTTGASDGTRKKLTPADLLKLKRSFDKMGIPQKDRILVLCSDHVNDLLETEQKFKDHYNINQTEGKIARLFGFDLYEYNGTPYYTVSTKTKLVWGAATANTDTQSSVAFYAGRMMKANGSVQMYYSEASKDPLYHRNLVNFRKWGICLPLSNVKCQAAIISDVA